MIEALGVGGNTRPHDCNAWCDGDVHARIMWTRGKPVPVGVSLILMHGPIRVVKVEQASPELPLAPGRPRGYDSGWIVWYIHEEPPSV